MPILSVRNLTKIFYSGFWPFSKHKKFVAVDNISFEIEKGEILGFLGANGAGKTTTIQMLLGILTPTSGSISYFAKDFQKNRFEILKNVGFASGYDKLPGSLTIWENLDIFGRIYNLTTVERNERITKLLKFFDMWNMRDKQTGMLSAGQSTRVMLAKAFLPNPEIVLLDEPTAALDPDVAQEVRKFILEQKHQFGTSILLTSHNMDEVTEVCDRVLVLRKGSIIADNSPEQLAASIKTARLHLILSSGLENLIALLKEEKLEYKLHEHTVEISIDEQKIASFLIKLTQQNIIYSGISIDKPELEDYFLSIIKK